MIYHLLPEGEPFSDIDGGALSRWVANAVRGTECIVACPYYDKTWNFVPGQLLELPTWRHYGRIRGAFSRGTRFLDKLCQAAKPLQPLMKLLVAGDVVWIHNRPSVAAHLAKVLHNKGIRIVLHMQNSHLLFAGFRTVAALRNVSVVFCSEYIANEVAAKHPDALRQAYLIPNGADERRFFPDRSHVNPIPQIVFAGRLVPDKGVHVLLAAMRRLEEKGIAARCIVIGGAQFGSNEMTSYVRSLHELKSGNTEIRGYLSGEAYADSLRQADIFCSPGVWQEPFGMVIVEAMASGLPVVASRVGGIPEILKYGGGVLVAPNSPESLASALEYLILDKSARQRTALDASQSFLKHFTWQVVRSKYRHVLEDVMHECAPQPAVQQEEIAAST
jgi:spore coat protein SA